MSTSILGISAFYHDSAACLVVDGEIIAAAQEERFSRKKHDHRFPANAVDYCLTEAGISIETVDSVVFYDKPWLKFERLLETYLSFAPRGLPSFLKSMPLWLKEKLWMDQTIKDQLGKEIPILYPEHHQSHAASAFYPSPFEQAAIITMDGVGEWATASWGIGHGNQIELSHEMHFPHSLGLLYSAFTYYTGFKVNSGEYKVMGLAPYGEPEYADLIREHLIHIRDDGSFWMDMKYFKYCYGLTMTTNKFHDLFGGPPREPESDLTQREMNLARSVQEVVEEVMLKTARHVRSETGQPNLCLAGGVALNCVANGKLLRENVFENIWIQPAAGDAGGALGAALFGWHQVNGNPRNVEAPDAIRGSLLGPDFSDKEIEESLRDAGASYEKLPDGEIESRVAELIAEGNVVGLFQGRMEFGPRALGNRSILGDPRDPAMQSVINQKIKFRESFRPFAPICLEDDAADYFDLDAPSPYMLIVAPVREERRTQEEGNNQASGFDKLAIKRSDIPAVTHVDYSARIQTVSGETNPFLYNILTAFKEKTGCSVLINTSFNVRGEPIVCSPFDALRCFFSTEMDVVVLGNYVALKKEQAHAHSLSRPVAFEND